MSPPQAVCEKTSCVHPGRPVANACPDCPRRKATMRMAKSKCGEWLPVQLLHNVVVRTGAETQVCGAGGAAQWIGQRAYPTLTSDQPAGPAAHVPAVHPQRPVSAACADCPRRK